MGCPELTIYDYFTAVEAKPKSADWRNANGNISQYLDSSGTIQAHYEYSPFGKITTSSGTQKDDFRVRYSTKYLDKLTGDYDYGLRDYSAGLGRWRSRDLLGEKGGRHLYRFCFNNAFYWWDYLGLIPNPFGKSFFGDANPEADGALSSVVIDHGRIEVPKAAPGMPFENLDKLITPTARTGNDWQGGGKWQDFPDDFKESSPIEGESCCQREAELYADVIILSRKVTKIKGKANILHKRAKDVKWVWFRCYSGGATPFFGQDKIAGSYPDSTNKREYRGVVGYQTYAFGVIISYYSCEGWSGGKVADGVWTSLQTRSTGQVPQGWFK